MSQDGFKKIERDDEAPLGPPALLLCGYSPEESEAVASLLKKVEAPWHRVVLCTEAMLAQTLGEALAGGEKSASPVPPEKLPRVLVLSGMTGAQLHALLGQYSSTQLPRPIFATATPVNLGVTVRDLLIDLLQEHRAMAGRR